MSQEGCVNIDRNMKQKALLWQTDKLKRNNTSVNFRWKIQYSYFGKTLDGISGCVALTWLPASFPPLSDIKGCFSVGIF